MPWWGWILVGALMVVVLRQRVFARLRPGANGSIDEGVDGEAATAIEAIPPGVSGRVMLRGSRWTGRNQGNVIIPAGALCRVERHQGLILDVRLESRPAPPTAP